MWKRTGNVREEEFDRENKRRIWNGGETNHERRWSTTGTVN